MRLTKDDERLLAEYIGKPWKEPTHGPCCMCQRCGNWHEDCYCGAWGMIGAVYSLEVAVRAHRLTTPYIHFLMVELGITLADFDTGIVDENTESPVARLVTASPEKKLRAILKTLKS